ncbi:MAG TPA: hypothetical protein VN193_07210 [Candidatus Angelobacter sp.]|jgi:hypothetical protein|nr:hypothetical protein [Candidatus Angelobacter sp.]
MTNRLKATDFFRRHKTLLTVLTVVAVAGGGGGVFAGFRTAAPVQSPPIAQHGGTGTARATATATPSQPMATPTSEVTTTSAVTAAMAVASHSPGHVTATATPYPTKPPGMPRCQDSDFVLRAPPEQRSYSISSGQRVIFDITLTYQGAVECQGYGGSGWPTVHIFNAQGQLVFADECSDVCGSFPPYNPVAPGRQVVNTTAWFDDKECSSSQCWDCHYNCPPRPPVAPGSYTAYVTDDPYKQSPTVSFQLTP